MVEDHSVYCSVALLSYGVLSVITMKVDACILKKGNGSKCQKTASNPGFKDSLKFQW